MASLFFLPFGFFVNVFHQLFLKVIKMCDKVTVSAFFPFLWLYWLLVICNEEPDIYLYQIGDF